MPTINLAPNESSERIAVTALKLLGIDTDKPVLIATAAGAVIGRTSHRHALDRAMKRHPGLRSAIARSDHGCQYTSHAYLEKLAGHGLKVSMSAKGNCYDKAAMESF